jgi:hypothetical protein
MSNAQPRMQRRLLKIIECGVHQIAQSVVCREKKGGATVVSGAP